MTTRSESGQGKNGWSRCLEGEGECKEKIYVYLRVPFRLVISLKVGSLKTWKACSFYLFILYGFSFFFCSFVVTVLIYGHVLFTSSYLFLLFIYLSIYLSIYLFIYLFLLTKINVLSLCSSQAQCKLGIHNERENYIELHRNSDHTDPRVQARRSVLNQVKYELTVYEQNVFRSNRSQTACSASGNTLLYRIS